MARLSLLSSSFARYLVPPHLQTQLEPRIINKACEVVYQSRFRRRTQQGVRLTLRASPDAIVVERPKNVDGTRGLSVTPLEGQELRAAVELGRLDFQTKATNSPLALGQVR